GSPVAAEATVSDQALPPCAAVVLLTMLGGWLVTASNTFGADFEWLQWSSTTQWPPGWVERIARDSVEVEPGIFEVRGGTTYAPTNV
ncbi:MAG: hypothetical protein ACRDTF_23510, partial [Pseudonocardiaceae bacterium]